jgi:hypothetical protein
MVWGMADDEVWMMIRKGRRGLHEHFVAPMMQNVTTRRF